MRHIEHAGEVDRDDVFPIVDHGFGRAQHAVAAGDAGIVDQDRDLPDLVGDLFCHRDAVVAPGDVEREAFGLAAGVADFLRRFGRRLLVHVEQHHARALAGIAVRDRAPDAGACAGDDRDVILEKGHGGFLCFWFWRRIASVPARTRWEGDSFVGWARRKRAHYRKEKRKVGTGSCAPLPTLRDHNGAYSLQVPFIPATAHRGQKYDASSISCLEHGLSRPVTV